jgi:hypothetical protein
MMINQSRASLVCSYKRGATTVPEFYSSGFQTFGYSRLLVPLFWGPVHFLFLQSVPTKHHQVEAITSCKRYFLDHQPQLKESENYRGYSPSRPCGPSMSHSLAIGTIAFALSTGCEVK